MRTALLILVLAATPAAADPCSQFADPLAYNACLARNGPAARAVRTGAAPTGAEPRTPARRGRERMARRGRSEMVFSVGR